MSDMKLLELEWGGESIVVAWGHHDLAEFSRQACEWVSLDSDCFEACHAYIVDRGKRDGYDHWFEKCERSEPNAAAITMEVVQ